jgi:hypothetical protein
MCNHMFEQYHPLYKIWSTNLLVVMETVSGDL